MEDLYYKAKDYMEEYDSLVKKYKKEVGFFRRLLEYFAGSDCYDDIENKLYDKYGLSYVDAYYILKDNNGR